MRTRTLTNLSSLSIEQIEAMRRVLEGERLGPLDGGLECTGSKLHGHVDAVRIRRGARIALPLGP